MEEPVRPDERMRYRDLNNLIYMGIESPFMSLHLLQVLIPHSRYSDGGQLRQAGADTPLMEASVRSSLSSISFVNPRG